MIDFLFDKDFHALRHILGFDLEVDSRSSSVWSDAVLNLWMRSARNDPFDLRSISLRSQRDPPSSPSFPFQVRLLSRVGDYRFHRTRTESLGFEVSKNMIPSRACPLLPGSVFSRLPGQRCSEDEGTEDSRSHLDAFLSLLAYKNQNVIEFLQIYLQS